MTEELSLAFYSRRGTVFYTALYSAQEKALPRLPEPPCRPRRPRRHSVRITRLFLADGLLTPPRRYEVLLRLEQEKRNLATRASAKRVLGSVFSSLSSNPPAASSSAATSSRSSSPNIATRRFSFAAASADSTSLFSRRSSRLSATINADELAMSVASQETSQGRTVSPSPGLDSSGEIGEVIASGNGLCLSIILAEPTIYLTGLDHDGTTQNLSSAATALLRGRLQLNVTKSAKIKAVTLKFTGRARTEWPEGIPPAKIETFEEESLRTQVLPFFNALYEGSETGYGTLCNYAIRDKGATTSVTNLSNMSNPSITTLEVINPNRISAVAGLTGRANRSSTILSAKDIKRLSLQNVQSRSFSKGDAVPAVVGPTPAQKGYKVFQPGVYEYSFELPIDNNSPESTKLQLASVVWQLEGLVERAGAFRANLHGKKEIPVVRSPSEDSLELVEPISISRRWENQLHYEIMISGKSFPLGSRIPIAFKLTPLAKVQVHRLKVFVSENIEYFTSNKKVTRRDVTRKILLLEKVAGKPLGKEYSASEVNVLHGGEFSPEKRAKARWEAQRHRDREAARTGTVSEEVPPSAENLLGDIDLGLENYWGATELEMNVQLPTCEMMEKDKSKKLHPDCTWKNAKVHHWIKIVMRISRTDTDDPTGKKRRHFEISIDSPFTILDCRTARENLALPEYSGATPTPRSQQHVCGCPNAAISNVPPEPTASEINDLNTNSGDGPPEVAEIFAPGLPRPPQAHLSTNTLVQRPIHMLRNPSYNPPPFDAEEPPPPMVTPPPLYDHIIGTPSHDGMADYFARLDASLYNEDNPNDDEDLDRPYSRGRVNVPNPRTPGGRLARSMDVERRPFNFNTAEFNTILNRQVGNEPIAFS